MVNEPNDALLALKAMFASVDAQKIMTVELAKDLLARCETAITHEKEHGSTAMFPIGSLVLRELVMAWLAHG